MYILNILKLLRVVTRFVAYLLLLLFIWSTSSLFYEADWSGYKLHYLHIAKHADQIMWLAA
jgi:hypothetical protein